MPGSTPVWGVSLPLQFLLPEEGLWDIYAVVRVEGAKGKPSDLAMRLGIHPGPVRELTLEELGDEEYHAIKLPGGPYRFTAKRNFWAAPPNSKGVKFVYVDRVFAVRRGKVTQG